jgi:hypothetical protein
LIASNDNPIYVSFGVLKGLVDKAFNDLIGELEFEYVISSFIDIT